MVYYSVKWFVLWSIKLIKKTFAIYDSFVLTFVIIIAFFSIHPELRLGVGRLLLPDQTH
ncbi:Uncharacterised protein [Yersinia pseudotuberculosis]|nr:Uncharacterised protein [Yersinia pseudotuberculosis]CNI59315.1 Uncharacterised protein [Yersinia pseudotuberculosis]CNJ01500.1 Uncharacterised protein [Yersinia pseudotuberculosis]VEE71962.1 Uncharacterised protein [Yersinia pseudotuberculosis]